MPLREAVFTRGRDWPLWLPGRDADQPLPAWLTKLLMVVPVKALDFATHFTQYLSWTTLARLWSKPQ